MGQCKIPHYLTGRRGPRWGNSLRAAAAAGAVIVHEETGEPVVFLRSGVVQGYNRPWVAASDLRKHKHSVKEPCARCRRYDSYDCVPVWPPDPEDQATPPLALGDDDVAPGVA